MLKLSDIFHDYNKLKMGAYNCDSLINNKVSFTQIETLFQKTINSKEISNSEKSISIQYNLLEEYNYLKEKENFNKEFLQISKKYKIISGFMPLIKEKEIFIKWIKILYNFENLNDFKMKKKQKISNNKIFQINLENDFLNNKKPFLKLVSQGLPHNLRQFIWTIIIDKDEKDISNISNNEKEKIHLQTLISLNKNNKDIEQIEKDVYRTFVNEKDKTEKNINLLKQLLIALNNLNEKIGYCQGINFIVGFILKITKFNKVKAFHLSRLILSKIKGYFTKDFPLLKYNLKKFNQGFKALFPKLYNHFKDNDIVDELWIGKWIQTLFTVNLPFKEACYIWDSLLVYGVDFIVPISLSIIHFTEKQLLKLKDSSDIISFFQEIFNPNPNSIINKLYKEEEEININDYVIQIHEIISYAKKIRNQLNLGPVDGNEYTGRNLLDFRRSFRKLSSSKSITNYEKKMEKINAERNEENNIEVNSPKNNPSQESTEDLSSINKNKNNNNDINNNDINEGNNINNKKIRRVNKFYTVYHKDNKIEEKNSNNDIKNKNTSTRCLSHHISISNDFINNYNNFYLNSPIINKININNNNNDDSNDSGNLKTININVENASFPKFKNNYNKTFSFNNNNKNFYNGTFNNNNNSNNYNKNLLNNNRMVRHQAQRSFNLYQHLNRMSLYKNLNGNNIGNLNELTNINNNIFTEYRNTIDPNINNNNVILNNNNTLDMNFNLNRYQTLNYNCQNNKRNMHTPEFDRIKLKEKMNDKFNNNNNNIDDDIIFRGVNEFYEGEKCKNDIPEFINIQNIKGYKGY